MAEEIHAQTTEVAAPVERAEKKEVATSSTNKITDYSLGIFGTSDNFLMAMQMAKALASSNLVPNYYQNNASNCLIALEQAQRLNMSPMMVMQNLYPIQGKPSWASKFLIAMINASNKFDMELQYEETKDKNGKPFSCTCWTMKNGRRIEGLTVDMDMANAEGWTSKNGSKWKTIPQLMLRYRAASFFASLNCPEITLGMYTEDEVIDNDMFGSPLDKMKVDVQEANSEIFVDADVVEETKGGKK